MASSERETVDCVGVRVTRTRPLGRRGTPTDDPRTIDRFTVLRRLGVGGMSVVYEALDERIGRRVALKLMLVGDAESDRERLRREAQALARVSHPNVVEVFEIGEHDGKAYVAMELVEGESLDRWLRVRPRSPAEIVEAFVQAGEGLAAAHAHGLVHRDFKPGNVLMGSDGRVRVVDFGLVRESGGGEASSSAQLPLPAEISGGSLPASAWTESLTRTGAMVGTPAYMSPEQLAGIAAGPASDQFSFCVALYEALHGQHPFVIDGHWQQLPYNVLEGRLQPPTHKHRVPAALGKVVTRGLALRPEARWPTMEALLPALRRSLDRRGPRLPSLVVGGVVLVVGAGFLHGSMQSPEEHHCRRGALVMQRAWNPEVRDELREAWVGTGLSGAADTWARVDARLQLHAEDWWGIHHTACSGSSPATSSATCLMRWADGLRTHLEVMERPNESLLHNAVQMVSELPSLERCSAALEAPPDMLAPDAPPWQDELDRVDALISAAQYDEALPLVEDLVARAGSEGSARLAAEANLRLGRLLTSRVEIDAAAAAFEEAYLGAKPLGLDRLAAESALALLQLFGEIRPRPDDANRWANHARAETERVSDPVLTGRYLNSWGRALRSQWKLEEALAQHEQALALQLALPRVDSSDLALSHFQLGSVLGLLDRGDEARPHLEEALRIQEQELGPGHPRVVATLINLGIFLTLEGRDAEALPKLMLARELALEHNPNNIGQATFPLRSIAGIHLNEGRARQAADELRVYLDGYVSTRGPDDTNAAYVEFLSCEIALHEGDYELALRHCRRALTQEGLDTLDVDAPTVHAMIATILLRKGEPDEALASQRRAYDHVRQRLEAEPDALAPSQRRWMENDANHGLGRVLAQAGQHEEALPRLEQASAGYAAGSDSTAWRKHDVELDIGTTLLALGRPEAARTRLRTVVAAIEARTGPECLELQRALIALAQAELEAGDGVVARELAERALGLLEARPEAVPEVEAGARFVLARSLVADRVDRSRALTLARRAETQWAAQEQAYPRELAEVRAWLAEHGDRASRRPT